jgi:2-C-methyl-D-erythritol 4-phosphate cytidylyltransferase
MEQDYVIIVAGGKGLRMGADTPKQFLPIGGKPILMRTIEQFYNYSNNLHIIVVLPREQQDYWRELCRKHHFTVPHEVADGGSSRFESSRNGLALIPDDASGVVAIHDGVRPFVSPLVIARCIEAAREDFASIPVVPVTSTLRYVDSHHGGRNVQRSDYREVQTPQVFDIQLAKQAFRQPYQESFTDDASVVESLGCQVVMVEGNRENVKITTPYDLVVADVLLKQEQSFSDRGLDFWAEAEKAFGLRDDSK